MTARTAVTPIALTRDGGVDIGAGTSGASTMTVASPGAYKCQLMVTNGGVGSINVTLRARGNGVDAAGNAQTSGYQPMAQASVGDLVVAVGAGVTKVFHSLTLDRFQQADGALNFDLSGVTSVSVWALQSPYLP